MVLSSMYKSLGLILCAMKRKGKEDEKEGGDGGGEEEEERKKTEGSERGLNKLRIRDTQMKITLTIISLSAKYTVLENVENRHAHGMLLGANTKWGQGGTTQQMQASVPLS